MRTARRATTTLITVLLAIIVSIASTLTLAAALAATALIVPGTGTPNANGIDGYLENARDYYIAPFNPACTKDNDCTLEGINYPAQFWPIPLPGWGGLTGDKWDVSTGAGLSTLNGTLVDTLAQNPANTPVILMGYSQGANIVSREKRNLAGLPKDQNYLSFVMIGNTNRPNGGLFERLAFLGHVPILDATFGLPAPTDTCDHICATDIAFQYDGVSDFPIYPVNALAVLNAIAGFWYVHGTYLAPNQKDVGELPDDYTPEELAVELADQDNWEEHGDTRYVTIPTRTLPIVRPFLEFAAFTGTGFLITPIVDFVAPLLRVLIDTGYDRTLSYGVPAPFRLIPRINPVTFVQDVAAAIGEGFQAAFGPKPVPAPAQPAAIVRDEQRTPVTVPPDTYTDTDTDGADVLPLARSIDTTTAGDESGDTADLLKEDPSSQDLREEDRSGDDLRADLRDDLRDQDLRDEDDSAQAPTIEVLHPDDAKTEDSSVTTSIVTPDDTKTDSHSDPSPAGDAAAA
ncbi:PE-PPE domain-containing protein [Mycolicibacterium neoaurum]|uniref:PE-PPE domain-containing protein n=1 Tax=Mycolicibacterium neoaurum TaxID=1795 RepID=UPI0026716256|nr:PE-PPE domain-containing protein [Mycolicibacterium neoaurum]MDO3402188.1 PE-PPE domain-containing protein [Mycolicibacterium neoaurum]